jgi:hypothetical protein
MNVLQELRQQLPKEKHNGYFLPNFIWCLDASTKYPDLKEEIGICWVDLNGSVFAYNPDILFQRFESDSTNI